MRNRIKRLAMIVLWPSFLAAAMAEGMFFSVLSPDALSSLEPMAVYTIGFFFFWCLCALASLLSCYLLVVSDEERRM